MAAPGPLTASTVVILSLLGFSGTYFRTPIEREVRHSSPGDDDIVQERVMKLQEEEGSELNQLVCGNVNASIGFKHERVPALEGKLQTTRTTPSQTMSKLFHNSDKNGDEKLSPAELIFYLDEDSNGHISFDELKAVENLHADGVVEEDVQDVLEAGSSLMHGLGIAVFLDTLLLVIWSLFWHFRHKPKPSEPAEFSAQNKLQQDKLELPDTFETPDKRRKEEQKLRLADSFEVPEQEQKLEPAGTPRWPMQSCSIPIPIPIPCQGWKEPIPMPPDEHEYSDWSQAEENALNQDYSFGVPTGVTTIARAGS